MLAAKLLSGMAGGAEEKLYVDDVFSAYTYTGNGSTQTINNGIDLAGKGGLVWGKSRSANWGHYLADTSQGSGRFLSSNTTGAVSIDSTSVTAFNSNGFSIGNAGAFINNSGVNYVSWTFRKSPKFFDVVTFTAPAYQNSTFSTSVSTPGIVIIKRYSAGNYPTETSGWWVWHRSLGDSKDIFLNESSAAREINSISVSASNVTFKQFVSEPTQFVAYIFAHDPSADGIIQCGSFTSDGSTQINVNLGWEPQFVLFKNASSTGGWWMFDTARGLTVDQGPIYLQANSSNAESSAAATLCSITNSGFKANTANFGNSIIYLAIRRPNKPPTSGTQVYNAIARTGTGAAATVTGVGFAPDAYIGKGRNWADQNLWLDRLRGHVNGVMSDSTQTESTGGSQPFATSFDMDGLTLGGNSLNNKSGSTFINHFFRRAPGFFDVVCYTGTGVARTVNHSLGVVPELVIIKSRGIAANWAVYSGYLGGSNTLLLDFDGESAARASYFNSTAPTDSVFTVGTANATNSNASSYVAYLFASLPGISKCGAYTGNGTSQTIDCGFTTGARFFLVKATSTTGSWWIFDSVRGVIAAADPALQLNSTAAEVTSADAVDPASVGIVVNQEATCSINANGVSYIYLALS